MFVFALSLLIVILSQLDRGWAATDYCSIASCPEMRSHTLCRYPSSAPSARCTNYVDASLTQAEITAIVNQHNVWRQKVSQGLETRGNPGPQPPASNMQPLTWDAELATIAQRLANQCTSGHDQCRNVERFVVGQNIGSLLIPEGLNPTAIEQMQAWYDEVSLFSKDNVLQYQFNDAWGHYSQIVWAETSYVGCGRVRYSIDGQTTVRLICNYGPTGNVVGQSVYR